MAAQNFKSLQKKYGEFRHPQGKVMIKGAPISKKDGFISEIEVDLTSGFDASAAELKVIGLFDRKKQLFDKAIIDRLFQIGNEVEIHLGYGTVLSHIFYGYISGVSYIFDTPEEEPYLRIECMDAKGLMMVNCSHTQRKEKSYGECVDKILQQYSFLVKEKKVGVTPPESRDIEMTDESDYEFIVRAAKKFGFAFYISDRKAIFDQGKENSVASLTLDESTLFQWYNISYNISGMSKKITVRGTDDGTGKLISSSITNGNRYGSGSSYNRVLGSSERIYIDETISNASEAKKRAEAIQEQLSWNFGLFRAGIAGLPEVLPGEFIQCSCIASDVSKKFYVNRVRHRLDQSGYKTEIEARVEGL